MQKNKPGSVRIIGGQWRGRRLPIAANSALRPTPDRVRETLFNWLAPVLPGRRCLDLYAGTGVLGLEALSRGAAECCFVERDAGTAAALRAAMAKLGAHGELVIAEVSRWLEHPHRPGWQLVFVDPPYAEADLAALCAALASGWLAPAALIYLEMPRGAALPELPSGWKVWREKVAGELRFMLLQTAP